MQPSIALSRKIMYSKGKFNFEEPSNGEKIDV
jgi:hypothetical protein